MKLTVNWTSLTAGFVGGVLVSVVTVAVSETPAERHARRMAEIQEFAAMAPLAAMIYKAQNGN
jgi:hypothetical protein